MTGENDHLSHVFIFCPEQEKNTKTTGAENEVKRREKSVRYGK